MSVDQMPADLMKRAGELLADLGLPADYPGDLRLVARAMLSERQKATEAERDRCASLLEVVTGTFARCDVENDWTGLLRNLSEAIRTEPQSRQSISSQADRGAGSGEQGEGA